MQTSATTAAADANVTAAKPTNTLEFELPTWLAWTDLKTGFGYRDNVLLSPRSEERSSFVRAGVSAVLSHPKRADSRTDYFASFEGSGTHYFSAGTINEESDAILLTQWSYEVHPRLKFSLNANAYYLDQIYDASDTVFQNSVNEQKTSGLAVGPTLRWDFFRSFWVSAEAMGKRENTPDGYYNRTVGEGTARLGWKPSKRFEMSIAGTEAKNDYDTREKPLASGHLDPGTILQTRSREGEFRADYRFDAAGEWRATLRLTTERFRDNGEGYWDFRSRKIAPELEWTSGRWTVHFDGFARRVEYRVQTVGIGFSPPPRVRDDYSTHVKVERELTRRWSVYADYTWERNRSNDQVTSYSMNEGLLGVRWNWEK